MAPDRVIFLDRDGVINRRRPNHVREWRDLEFLPGALDALRRLHELDERVVVVTNQSVVGRGLIAPTELDSIHDRMVEAVSHNGGRIERIYVCPHAPADGCVCRKPKAGLLVRAARDLMIDLTSSVLVGDSLSDVHAAFEAGCHPIMIGDATPVELDQEVPVVVDLMEAVALIASMPRSAPARC